MTLKPHRYGGPYTIEASSVVKSTKVTATLKDVLFGDVWICAGQSNMEMGVRTVRKEHEGILMNHGPLQKNFRCNFTQEVNISHVELILR